MLAGTCGYWATWSTPFRSKPNCASWWKSWWSVEMISPSVRRWSSGERPVVALLFIWSSDLLALSSCGMHWVCLRNKMVEYLTDWVMGTSNQAADDDVKCLTRWKPHERHKIYPNQNWNAETGGPERNYVKTFSTSKGWKYGRLFVNQLGIAPGSWLQRLDCVHIQIGFPFITQKSLFYILKGLDCSNKWQTIWIFVIRLKGIKLHS